MAFRQRLVLLPGKSPSLTNAFNSITETVPESAEADCVGKYLFLICSSELPDSISLKPYMSRPFATSNPASFMFALLKL